MSGDFSELRSRWNDFGPFVGMQQPRTVLPDMDIHGRSFEPGVPPRVVGEGEDRHLEWALSLEFPRNPALSAEERLAKARQLLDHLNGPPHHIQLSLDGDGRLVIAHQCGPMHQAVRLYLDKAWAEIGGGPVELIGTRGEFYTRLVDDSTLGPQPVPLLRRAIRSHSGQLDFDAYALHPSERRLLESWGGGADLAAKVFDRLGAKPANIAEKIARAGELAELGVFSPYTVEALNFLARTHREDALSKVNLRYNGHAMFSMAPLAWAATRAFPAKSFTLLASKYSGSRESGNLIRFLMRPEDRLLDRGESDRYEMKSREQLFASPLSMPVPQSRVVPPEMFIWEKAADLTKRLPEMAIAQGLHRFIIHNADDLKAARKEGRQFYGVELWRSRIKALEARFIGELYALLGAREVRTLWKDKVANAEVRIFGGGLLGMSIAEAHERFGMPRSNIVIFDIEKAVRDRAIAAGFRAADPDAEPPPATRRTVCFVATGGAAIDGSNVRCFGKEAIVFGLNSGGKVIDDEGESLRIVHDYPVGFEWHVDTGRGNAHTYRDRDQTVELESGERLKLHVVAGYMPANLLFEQWVDRFHVTGMAVLAAGLQLAEQKEPRVGPLDSRVDDELVRLAEKHGLLDPRPLDPRYDESPSALLGDLRDGFRPY